MTELDDAMPIAPDVIYRKSMIGSIFNGVISLFATAVIILAANLS
jgi:hypothetical protein